MALQDGHLVYGRPHTVPPFTYVYRSYYPHGMARGNEPHYHPDTVEICFVARGHLDWWSGEEAFELVPGNVLVVPPGVPHGSVDPTLQPCEFFALHLAPEELPPSVRVTLEALGTRYTGQAIVGETIRRLFDEIPRADPILPEVGMALAVLVVATLARATSECEARSTHRLVREAQTFLLADVGVPPTVEEVARSLGISPVWLTRLFRQHVGESPAEWLRTRRLAEAKRLLAMESDPVTEIAVRLGFSSSQYFATAFRHEFGMSPSAYRAHCDATWPSRSVAAISSPMRPVSTP